MARSSSPPWADSRYDESSAAHAPDDAQLIERTQGGDVQAFNLLVERYQQRVYAVCFRMIGDTTAHDATQDVFLSAYRNIQRYHGDAFFAWLLRIARNKCIDYLRARIRRATVSLDSHTSRFDDVAPREMSDGREDLEHRVLRAELARSLELKIQDLPAPQRLAVILSDIQGYSHEEIRMATGWPAGTVKSRLRRGRARLRNTLGSLAPLPGY